MRESSEQFLTCEVLRDIVCQVCGFDPGSLSPDSRLLDVDGEGLNRFVIVLAVEHMFCLDFPADLVAAFETIADLIYFTNTKIGHVDSPEVSDV